MDLSYQLDKRKHSQQNNGGKLVGFFSFLYLLLMIVLMLYARSVIHNVYICSLAVIVSAW